MSTPPLTGGSPGQWCAARPVNPQVELRGPSRIVCHRVNRALTWAFAPSAQVSGLITDHGNSSDIPDLYGVS